MLFSNHPQIEIPAVHGEWCSARILTSTWCEGRPFESFVEQATQQERDAAGKALYEFYLGALYRHGLFNADPHPGNLLFRRGGGTVILDHGCVRGVRSETTPARPAAVERAPARARPVCRSWQTARNAFAMPIASPVDAPRRCSVPEAPRSPARVMTAAMRNDAAEMPGDLPAD